MWPSGKMLQFDANEQEMQPHTKYQLYSQQTLKIQDIASGSCLFWVSSKERGEILLLMLRTHPLHAGITVCSSFTEFNCSCLSSSVVLWLLFSWSMWLLADS